jgi:DNA polymerase
MDSRRLAYLKALDIDVWERRETADGGRCTADGDRNSGGARESHDVIPSGETCEPSVSAVVAPRPALGGRRIADSSPAPRVAVATLDWDALEATVRNCTSCPLHETRTQAVFGVGNRQAEWMVIGEAPGADEDRQGEPFVGRAGQLLNSMLKAVGLRREQVFIANILKSRPPNNRDPRPEEVRACIPYLFRQIELIDPKLILCVGRIAAQTLLQTETPIGKLRGRLHRIASDRPMIVTYHPAYLLRSPGEKRKTWSDLLLAVQTLESGSARSNA